MYGVVSVWSFLHVDLSLGGLMCRKLLLCGVVFMCYTSLNVELSVCVWSCHCLELLVCGVVCVWFSLCGVVCVELLVRGVVGVCCCLCMDLLA